MHITHATTRFITDVDGDGPAYAAGLRDGQRLVSVRLARRTDLPATVGVEENDAAIDALSSTSPLVQAITRQRVTMREGLDDDQRAVCLAELGVPR